MKWFQEYYISQHKRLQNESENTKEPSSTQLKQRKTLQSSNQINLIEKHEH